MVIFYEKHNELGGAKKMTLERIPLVTWPHESGNYKFLQVFGGETPWFLDYYDKLEGMKTQKPLLIIGQKSILESDSPWNEEQHVDIMREFIKKYDLPFRALDHVQFYPSDPFMLVGAGKLQLDLERKTMEFYDGSYSYEMGTHKDHVEVLGKHLLDWTLSIRQYR